MYYLIYVCLRFQQCLHHRSVSILGGVVQRGVSAFVNIVYVLKGCYVKCRLHLALVSVLPQ